MQGLAAAAAAGSVDSAALAAAAAHPITAAAAAVSAAARRGGQCRLLQQQLVSLLSSCVKSTQVFSPPGLAVGEWEWVRMLGNVARVARDVGSSLTLNGSTTDSCSIAAGIRPAAAAGAAAEPWAALAGRAVHHIGSKLALLLKGSTAVSGEADETRSLLQAWAAGMVTGDALWSNPYENNCRVVDEEPLHPVSFVDGPLGLLAELLATVQWLGQQLQLDTASTTPSTAASGAAGVAPTAPGLHAAAQQKLVKKLVVLQHGLDAALQQCRTAAAAGRYLMYRTLPSSTNAIIIPLAWRDALLQHTREVLSAELANQLSQFGRAVCAAVPVTVCCNHPSCVCLERAKELFLVNGKSCICGQCKVARYCSKACQVQHFKQGHKAVCKRIAAANAGVDAAAQQAASTSASAI